MSLLSLLKTFFYFVQSCAESKIPCHPFALSRKRMQKGFLWLHFSADPWQALPAKLKETRILRMLRQLSILNASFRLRGARLAKQGHDGNGNPAKPGRIGLTFRSWDTRPLQAAKRIKACLSLQGEFFYSGAKTGIRVNEERSRDLWYFPSRESTER